MINLLDIIGVLLLRLLYKLFKYVPIRVALFLGKAGGCILFYLNIGRRKIAYANMKAAFYKEKTPKQIKKMVQSLYMNLGQIVMETLCSEKFDKAYTIKHVVIDRVDRIKDSVENGKGVIFLTAHMGNWELSSMVGSLLGYPICFFAREQKMKRVNAFINSLRTARGAEVIEKGSATRNIIKALRQGKIVGMLSDQNGPAGGTLADFFGRPVPTVDGAQRLSVQTGAIILPTFIVREKGPFHKIFIGEPFTVEQKDEVHSSMQKYNRTLEEMIRRYPDQWLWTHRRWKKSPFKKVVILSDGKPGHINQSRFIAETIVKIKKEQGFDEKFVEIQTIDIKFKRRFWRNIINVFAVFWTSFMQGNMWLLQKALTEESYNSLVNSYCDVVISAGSSLLGVNVLFKKENMAKNIICMSSGIVGSRKFDKIFVGPHDAHKYKNKQDNNIIITEIVPNRINKKLLKQGKEDLLMHVNIDNKVIGVLFGGDNAQYSYGKELMRTICEVLETVCNDNKIGLLFTTSRRSSAMQEDIVSNCLGGRSFCKYLVIANRDNPSYTISGILGVSDIVVVTGESISMVSEAVSSAKKVIVLKGETTNKKKNKYDSFLSLLEKKGLVQIAGIDSLEDTIKNLINTKPNINNDQINAVIYKTLKEMKI